MTSRESSSAGRPARSGLMNRDSFRNLLLLLASVMALFLVLEVSTRIYWGEYRLQNFWAYKRNLF